ncbi:MAG: hypothetical protein JWQ62_2022, partial [Lacunisphaera sp.]|nr:hypothetical protein [Lacunisphaera sp.]
SARAIGTAHSQITGDEATTMKRERKSRVPLPRQERASAGLPGDN